MSKIMELKPKTGGGDTNSGTDCLIIEKVSNGYIMRAIAGSEDEGILQECRVYTDRGELMKDVASKL